MKTEAYVYRLTDKVTGKYYIGSNYKKGCCATWLGTRYFTSSKLIRGLFQYDPDRFVREILVIGDPDYVLDFETRLLEKLDAKNDHGSYNCHNNKNNLNSRKVGLLTKEMGTGIHGRSKEKMSLDGAKAGKISCEIRHRAKDADGKSIFAKQIGRASHTIKNSEGKSVRMIDVGKRSMEARHKQKDDQGRSLAVMNSMYECKVCGYRNIAMVLAKHQKLTGHEGKSKV